MKSEERIFADVMAHAAAEHAAIVDRECNGDTALRERVLTLLRGYEGAGAELEASPFAAEAAVARARDVGPAREDSVGTRIGRYKLLQRLAKADAVSYSWPSKRSPSADAWPSR